MGIVPVMHNQRERGERERERKREREKERESERERERERDAKKEKDTHARIHISELVAYGWLARVWLYTRCTIPRDENANVNSRHAQKKAERRQRHGSAGKD